MIVIWLRNYVIYSKTKAKQYMTCYNFESDITKMIAHIIKRRKHSTVIFNNTMVWLRKEEVRQTPTQVETMHDAREVPEKLFTQWYWRNFFYIWRPFHIYIYIYTFLHIEFTTKKEAIYRRPDLCQLCVTPCLEMGADCHQPVESP